MSSPDLTFQEIINLEIATALPAIRRGAEPPADGAFPYIQFGQSTVGDDYAPGNSVTAEVHVWSTAQGPHEVKQLQQTIKEALQTCTRDRGEWHYSAVRQQTAHVFLDEDGETWHGVQRFRALAHLI